MALSCARGGLGSGLGNIYLLKGYWSDLEQAVKEMVNYHPWKYSKNVWMWHLGTWFSYNVAVIGSRLDLMIFEVFSNQSGSMSLWKVLASILSLCGLGQMH